ncbi:MAG: porin [Prevotellaceae bacterium]|nr:porin [Prevotellaceae bacterium]
MKKTFAIIATMFIATMMAKAETANSESGNTDAAILEEHKTLVEAPANTTDKDLKYWANTVASRIKVTGYAQAGYTAVMPKEGENTNTFDMKRVVLMVGAEITPQFYAFFMHEFKTKDMQEYYMEYRPCKAFNLRFGQSKTELSMENPMSPTVLESISPMSQGVFWLCGADPLINNPAGRDMGLMAYGDLFNDKLRYVVEVLNGGQINTTDKNNQKNIIAKLEYKPVKNFRLSVSGQKGYGYAMQNSIYNGSVQLGETYRQDRYAFGMEWKSKLAGTDYHKNRCTMVRTEMLGGKDGDCNSFGAYVSSAIPVYKGLDIVAIADYMNYNTDASLKKTNLTAGVQYWIFKKCRLQAQYTYSIKSDAMKNLQGDNESMLQAQVQVAF